MAVKSFALLLLWLVVTEQELVAAKSNMCSPNPCANGGKCYARLRGFLCYCKNGFTGPTCKANKWLDVHDYHQLITMIKKQQADINRLKKAVTQPCVSSRGVINWKQRAIDSLNSNSDSGLLVGMSFKKRRDDTHLRLTFSSNLRQLKFHACSTWYFLIDGHQCIDPAPINAAIYQHINTRTDNNEHRHNTVVGVCRGTRAGTINSGSHYITMNVGKCKYGHPLGDACTGWASTLTMLIEELCPPQ